MVEEWRNNLSQEARDLLDAAEEGTDSIDGEVRQAEVLAQVSFRRYVTACDQDPTRNDPTAPQRRPLSEDDIRSMGELAVKANANSIANKKLRADMRRTAVGNEFDIRPMALVYEIMDTPDELKLHRRSLLGLTNESETARLESQEPIIIDVECLAFEDDPAD